jgi:hypothetical protein
VWLIAALTETGVADGAPAGIPNAAGAGAGRVGGIGAGAGAAGPAAI